MATGIDGFTIHLQMTGWHVCVQKLSVVDDCTRLITSCWGVTTEGET